MINFLPGSGLLSVIFMITPLVNWGPWLDNFSFLSLVGSARIKVNTAVLTETSETML